MNLLKGKAKTYGLALVVLIVWVIVGVQVFSAFNPDEEEEPVLNLTTRFDPKAYKPRDTFSIINNYRDPFSGKLPPSQSKATSSRQKRQPKRDSIVFPQIIYKGVVSDSDGGDRIYALSVNGQEILMSRGESYQEIDLVKGDASGITVRYKGKRKNYTK